MLSMQILMNVLRIVQTVHRTAQIQLDHSFALVALDSHWVMTGGLVKVCRVFMMIILC